MSSALIGCLEATPISTLSSYSASSSSTTTTTITVTTGTGSGSYTYSWTFTGTTCTITNGTTVTPTFTYSATGTTNAYCIVTDTSRGISVRSADFIITWTSGALAVGSMVSGGGSPDGTVDATTQGTVTGGTPPYTISWVRTAGNTCTLVSATGNPTSTATWHCVTGLTTSSTVRMNVTDNLGATAFNTTTISWAI
jgi:hypothetical protein